MPGTFDKKKISQKIKTDVVSKVGNSLKADRPKVVTSKKMIEEVINEKLPGILSDLESRVLSNFKDESIDLTKIPLDNLKVVVDRYFSMHSPRAWNKGESSFENKTLRFILKAKGGQCIVKHNKKFRIFTLDETLFNGIKMREMSQSQFTEYQKQKIEKKKN